jgi:hypothetical protein
VKFMGMHGVSAPRRKAAYHNCGCVSGHLGRVGGKAICVRGQSRTAENLRYFWIKCVTNMPGTSVRQGHEALRAREQQFLGLHIRESCCEYTGSKFQEYRPTVFGSHHNG